MRTPPPVLPPATDSAAKYKSSWFDAAGADFPLRTKAAGYGVLVAGIVFGALAILSLLGGVPSFGALAAFALIGLVMGVFTAFMGAKLGDGAGAVAQAFIQPSGNSTPYEQTFSYQEAMIMRGDVAGALESYEAIIAEQPTLVAPRLRAAEHYAKGNRNPRRAAELFRQVRELPGAPLRDAVYACSRLVDLYDGPLDEPGRAVVELRRIIELYPGSEMANRAQSALPELKARLDTNGARRADR
ncbi:hypothetical protein BH11GEM1_BH11GEM1_28340 [soil metagenome]